MPTRSTGFTFTRQIGVRFMIPRGDYVRLQEEATRRAEHNLVSANNVDHWAIEHNDRVPTE
ncbi:MAG: hypothetical protein AAB492_04995 [Patescibacteria group bacterium]